VDPVLVAVGAVVEVAVDLASGYFRFAQFPHFELSVLVSQNPARFFEE
jgi:hypothetical protein